MKLTIRLGFCMLAVALLGTMSTVAFADNFDSGVYTLTTTNGSNGFVTPNGASGFYLQGSNNAGCCSLDTDYSTTMAYGGVVSFDWSAHSNDVNAFFFDPFSIRVNGVDVVHVEGNPNQIYDANGSLSFSLNAGDTLSFDIFSKDGCCGPGTATISSYNTSSVPEPGSIALLGTGLLGLGGAIRRKIRL